MLFARTHPFNGFTHTHTHTHTHTRTHAHTHTHTHREHRLKQTIFWVFCTCSRCVCVPVCFPMCVESLKGCVCVCNR
jgi:ABC-type Zn2+ transport system substrate-binding protein/surface adhesin